MCYQSTRSFLLLLSLLFVVSTGSTVTAFTLPTKTTTSSTVIMLAAQLRRGLRPRRLASSWTSRSSVSSVWHGQTRRTSPSLLGDVRVVQTRLAGTKGNSSAHRGGGGGDDDDEGNNNHRHRGTGDIASFAPGQPVQVEVMSFGPLGASVDVVAATHDPADVIPLDASPLGHGLILQREIAYFRNAREGVDVVRGEILPAYVERTRGEEDDDDVRGQRRLLDIGLRPSGGKAKADDLAVTILRALQRQEDGQMDVGDKSDPRDINAAFPGASKVAFKKAVAKLYKEGKVKPGPRSIRLM